MGRVRARGDEEKGARREAILAAAARLLDEGPYDGLSMADLAAEVGLSKAALYLYFPTREVLFLEVLRIDLGAWLDGLGQGLSAVAFGDAEGVAGLLVGTLVARPRLVRLLGLLHLVLERHLDAAAVGAWKRWLLARVAEAGAALEGALPLGPGGGARLLVQVHALVVGFGQMADEGPVLAEVLAAPELAPLRVDLEAALRGALVPLLRGYLAVAAAR